MLSLSRRVKITKFVFQCRTKWDLTRTVVFVIFFFFFFLYTKIIKSCDRVNSYFIILHQVATVIQMITWCSHWFTLRYIYKIKLHFKEMLFVYRHSTINEHNTIKVEGTEKVRLYLDGYIIKSSYKVKEMR